jgi:membrane protease YdiL (CAAX protease family)
LFSAQQSVFPGAGDGYRGPALLPPLARFFVAALWTVGVFWGCGAVYALFPTRNLLPDLLFSVMTCVLTGVGFGFCVRVLDGNPKPFAPALSLPLDRTALRQWGSGVAMGGLLICVDAGCVAVLGSLEFHLHLSRLMLLRGAAVAVLLLFAALLEELAFRGYPFQKLTETCGALWAVLLLSLLFGAVHLWNPGSGGWWSWGFWNTVMVGLLLALARIRSGSLWLPFGMHFGWNLFQGAVLGLPVSGLRDFSSLITARSQGPVLLTGGAYGPEASATCAVVLLLGVPLLWRLTSERNIQHRPVRLPPQSGIL